MEKRLRTLEDLPSEADVVLVRVDFNVTVGSDGVVDGNEDYRIEAAVPTIAELQKAGKKVLLLTHRGRHGDSPAEVDLAPIHARLQKLLGERVVMTSELFGEEVERLVAKSKPGQVMMLGNVRADERELLANERFASLLAGVAGAYVNEAFSVNHRAHTSVTALARLLPAVAGRRVQLEVEALTKVSEQPDTPYVALVSGAKIETKIGMLRRLMEQVDNLLVGGVIANVFLAAKGDFPTDQFHPNDLAAAMSLWELDEKKIVLPEDVVVGSEDGQHYVKTVSIDKISEGADVWDIGETTVNRFVEICGKAKTITWNGPMGRVEVEAYQRGTDDLARSLAAIPAYKVVGGGDTVNALERIGVVDQYEHVSVGGGAMIAFLEGKRLPGLEPLYE